MTENNESPSAAKKDPALISDAPISDTTHSDAPASEIIAETNSETQNQNNPERESIENKSETNTKVKAETSAPVVQKSARAPWLVIILLCNVLLAGGVIAGFMLMSKQNKVALEHHNQQTSLLEQRLSQSERNSRQAQENLAQAHSQKIQELTTAIQTTQTQTADLTQLLAAQAKRLSALSDTSREDWLLAEALYLLRLANQRVRIERKGEGVDALLTAADAILRDLDDPALHPLRRAVANDLASIRLMSTVDVEGMHLALAALADHIEHLPLQFDQFAVKAEPLVHESADSNAPTSVTTRIRAAWQRFVASFSHAYRVIAIDELPKPIMSPENHVYLQQNLRLMIERAQLALMREEQHIFTTTLQQADAWLEQYFAASEPVASFRQQLANLKDQKITRDFPDISTSLELLNSYVRELHKLDGVKPSKPEEKNQRPEPDTSPESNKSAVGA